RPFLFGGTVFHSGPYGLKLLLVCLGFRGLWGVYVNGLPGGVEYGHPIPSVLIVLGIGIRVVVQVPWDVLLTGEQTDHAQGQDRDIYLIVHHRSGFVFLMKAN